MDKKNKCLHQTQLAWGSAEPTLGKKHYSDLVLHKFLPQL